MAEKFCARFSTESARNLGIPVGILHQNQENPTDLLT